MHYNGPVIRPHTDTDRIIIEVTIGCTHNSCTFCNFYKGVPFRVAPLSQVEMDLSEASVRWPHAKSLWLAGGNPFCLSTEKLIQLGDLVRNYFPDVHVSTYARVDDLFRKSVEDIHKIKDHGIDDVMIGIESGDDDVLSFVNKGYTAADIVRECQKLDQTSMTYRFIYLGGLAGKDKLIESARRSADVINQTHPIAMNMTNVSVLPDTKLYEQMRRGEFTEATELERIMEARALVENLNNEIYLDNTTAANNFYFTAKLPEEKAALLKKLDNLIDTFTDEKERMLHARRARMTSV